MSTSFLISLAAGYLIGSFPTGFLAVRWKHQKDIRTEGSGKTGGFNTFEVTRSKTVAIGVGVTDALKGLLASLGAWYLWPEEPMWQGAAIVGALLGHNYPVWLKFKGGRGLATVAGALFALNPFLIIFWCVVWFLTYRMTSDILKGNLTATVLSIPAVWLVHDGVVQGLMTRDVSIEFHAWLLTFICVILLVGHYDAIRDLLKGPEQKELEKQ